MSLQAMADNVRAERARRAAAAPAQRERARLDAAQRWTEKRRRAWQRSRPIFEAAFRRSFSPDRFTYSAPDNDNRVIVSINYEGKLRASCAVYLGEYREPRLRVQPVDESEPERTIQVGRDALYGEVAKLVEQWGLA